MILPFNVSGLPDTPEAKALKRLENLFSRSSIDVPLGLGGPTTAARMITIGGSFVGVGDSIALGLTTTLTPPSGNAAHGIAIEPSFVRAASGNHSVFSSAWIRPPNISGGAATIGTVATLYVSSTGGAGPTEGGNNYSFFVEGGNSRLYGQVEVGRGGVGPLKDLAIWVTADSTTDPQGSILMTGENTIGRTLAHHFSFAGGTRSAAIGAEQKDTAQKSADLLFITRTASGGGATAVRHRVTADGHFVPDANSAYDYGTTTTAARTIHYALAIKHGSTQILGPQGAAVADATDATSVILRLNELLARQRDHGIIGT